MQVYKVKFLNFYNKKMNQLKQLVSQILTNKDQKSSLYHSLLTLIQKNDTEISKQVNNLDSSILLNMMIKKANKHSNVDFYLFLQRFIQYTAKTQSKLYVLVFQIIPVLLTKYIVTAEQKLIHIQNCIRAIYNNQFVHFNKKLISRELLMNKSGEIGNLYKEHFHSTIKTLNQVGNLSEISKQQEINSFNRVSVVSLCFIKKNVLLLTVFNNLEKLTEKTVISYLWMVYVYCGGSQQEDQTGVSLYLLEKKNLFSIFKHYISVQEMSIILLTLYELSVQRKKNKFQILSAINMIHKKAANQSMFKLSEVAQSTIHLLEDQYSEAFS